METWKVHKYCETATLAELMQKKEKLINLMLKKDISDTNADKVLKLLDEYIELKSLFEEA